MEKHYHAEKCYAGKENSVATLQIKMQSHLWHDGDIEEVYADQWYADVPQENVYLRCPPAIYINIYIYVAL